MGRSDMESGLTDEMLAEFKAAIDGWRWPGPSDPHMTKAYKEDRAEMRVGLMLLEKGEERQAWRLLSGMDTILRDLIPDSLYYYLEESN